MRSASCPAAPIVACAARDVAPLGDGGEEPVEPGGASVEGARSASGVDTGWGCTLLDGDVKILASIGVITPGFGAAVFSTRWLGRFGVFWGRAGAADFSDFRRKRLFRFTVLY